MEWIVNVLLAKIKEYNPEMSEAQLKTRKFGLECILSDLSKFVIFLVIAIILKLTVLYMVSAFVYCTIRATTGGYHANSYKGCFFVSFFVFGIAVCSGRYLNVPLAIQIILLGISLVLNILFAPVEHPNKPVKDDAKRKRFKAISTALICLLGGISLLLPLQLAVTAEVSILLAAVMEPTGMVLNPVSKVNTKA